MSMDIVTFANRAGLVMRTFARYPNLVAEANSVRVSLGADPTTRDATLQTAPAGLRPGHRTQSTFTNALVHEVNKGKSGNLSTVTMANVIGSLTPSPPAATAAPVITYVSGGGGAGTQPGAQYARSNGTWTGSPTLTTQWLRNGANIAGQTAASYTTVAADAGVNLSCRVTGTNANGSTPSVSNVVAIT